MTKIAYSVIPRSDLQARMPPGSPTPRSGIYEERKSERATSVPGEPRPPIYEQGRGWVLVDPVRHKANGHK